jgi:hypothetical protein
MRHPSRTAFRMIGCVALATPSAAQQATIHGATPALVVEHLKTHLSPQGFVLESSSTKSALFTLDRGLVVQQGNPSVPVVHIVIELQLQFKPRADSLIVRAKEEAVGDRGRPMEFRRPLDSDRQNLQRLLDAVRAELDSGTAARDSTTRHDSTP